MRTLGLGLRFVCSALLTLPLSPLTTLSQSDENAVSSQAEAELETSQTNADPVGPEEPEEMSKRSEQDAVNQANNPLADLVAINFHNYYSPRLNGIPDETSNSMFLRIVTPFWRIIPRVSLPIVSAPASDPTSDVSSVAGLGDLNIFATFVVTPDGSPATLGIGPIYTAPTATNDQLGNGKHEIGAATLTVWTKGIFLVGGLISYQIGVGGDSSRPKTQFISAQIFSFFQLGKGYYLRYSPIWFFDLERPNYNVPFGLGAGKAIITPKAVFNLFIEPQFSVAVRGIGQPTVQIFAGMNVQFKTGKKHKSADRALNQLRAEHSVRRRMH